jgi:N-acetylated-alpha-linked acidic dipeptidase
LRFGSYATALQEDLDALRRDAVRRTRSAGQGSGGGERALAPITPDFSEVVAALGELRAAGEAADRAADAALRGGDRATIGRISDALMLVERAFLDPAGLPGRPWFRHMLIAPGLTTGYAPWPFPALQQAIEERNAAMFATESKRVVSALRSGADRLRAVAGR